MYHVPGMNVTATPAWLLLVFSLPAGKASERVQVWRKLQKLGCLPFRNSGYLLPNTPENRERLIWAAETVRASKGESSVLEVGTMDDLSVGTICDLFRQARDADYLDLEKQLKKLKPQKVASPQLLRLRRRFDEIVATDFFESKRRVVVQTHFERLSPPAVEPQNVPRADKNSFQGKTWVTRLRPGIDRVSSAWLISKFIDDKPRFEFAENPSDKPKAVAFDMYGVTGFGHVGNRCTFETLCAAFSITDKRVLFIGEAIHDADLEDRRFGREEGHTLNRILQGWAKQGVSDDELLKRGMELIEGLFVSLSKGDSGDEA